MAVSESFLRRLQDQAVPVEEVAVLYKQVFSVACSLQTPDAVVARMQKALTAMIADGTQAEIFARRSEEHTSELQSLMRISYAVFCLKKKISHKYHNQLTFTASKQNRYPPCVSKTSISKQ